MKRLLSHSFNYGLGNVLPQVIGFFLLPVYTRYLDPREYGVVELSMSLVGFLVPVFKLGLPGAVTRFYFDHKNNLGDLRLYISTLFYLLLISGAFFILFFTFLFYFFGDRIFSEFPFWPFIFIAIMIAAFSANNQLQQKLLQNKEQSKYAMLLKVVMSMMTIGLTLILVLVFNLKALGVLLSTLLVAFLVYIQSIYYFRNDLKLVFSKEMASQSLSFGIGIIPHHLSANATPFITKSLVTKLLSISALGIYSIVLRFFSPLEIIYSAIGTAFIPIYNDYRIKKEDIMLRNTIRKMLLLSFIIFVSFLITTPYLMRIMLPVNYHESIVLMPIIALAFIGKTIYQISIAEIFYSKKTKFVSAVTFSGLLVSVAILLLFYKDLGVEALCWGFSIGFAFWGLGAVIYKRKISDYNLFLKEISLYLTFSIVSWGLLYFYLY